MVKYFKDYGAPLAAKAARRAAYRKAARIVPGLFGLVRRGAWSSYMKSLICVIITGAIILGLSGCVNRFGANDNPPMRIYAADYI